MRVTTWTMGVLTLAMMTLSCGCSLIGWLIAPTANEDVVPAQVRLAKLQERGIVVVVDAAHGSNVTPTMCRQVVNTINGHLVKRARVNTRYLVAADDSSPERAKIEALTNEGPAQIAQAVGAGLAVYVRIEDFRIEGMADEYMKGRLFSRAALVGAEADRVLWPASGEPLAVRAQVELETQGRDRTITRLAEATAHCIVRHFYDCPRARYRTADEMDGTEAFGW